MTRSCRALRTLALVGLVYLAVAAGAALAAYEVTASGSNEAAAEFRRWLEFKEFQEFQAWRNGRRRRSGAEATRYDDGEDKFQVRRQTRAKDDPPPIDQPARMARYIVNQADWTSVATVSSRKDIESYPFVNIISFSDGPLGNGTGIPYMYLTPLDFTAKDVFKDNRATLMMTLAQGPYCQSKKWDPMDPRCARVVLTGKIKAVKEDNPEYSVAKNAVFGRHPKLANMPADHHFFFAKLKIGSIAVLDTFGGPKYVSVKDYLNPSNNDDNFF